MLQPFAMSGPLHSGQYSKLNSWLKYIRFGSEISIMSFLFYQQPLPHISHRNALLLQPQAVGIEVVK